MHRAHICYGRDADYIVWESLGNAGIWVEHARLMIPGSQLED